MDIKVLHKLVKGEKNQQSLFNLFEPYYFPRTDYQLFEYEVKKGEEMRIDLIFKSMYDLDPSFCEYYLEHVDIILNLNSIDNPLNITEGTILKYPDLEALDNFRVIEDPFINSNNSVTQKLVVPNTSKRQDPQRKKFIENNYSFPPTVAKNPKDPVVVQDGKFYVGGI